MKDETRFNERSRRLLDKAAELGVRPFELEFYFATGKRYKGRKAQGYRSPEIEPIASADAVRDWSELQDNTYLKDAEERRKNNG